ncbi:dockerin type I repeat-containing protein [Ruminococcus albus]|uniref:Dockerin domain-containing protein n=1 Tax=Ruminococcus albus TaxID=1264 RepID=A0A1I1J9Q0_RUMAL|nr:dockerin type I repeat-containing protein [Ruminococcus albus]SFC45307.1 hypothetical protein SAMN02910406_01732 [Ruminococcus albus]
MISKKIRALSAVMTAAVMCAMPVSAFTHVDDLPADSVTNVRLNKPYMNFGVKAGEDVDISDMKFAVKDSSGNKVAEFTGPEGKLNVLDDTLYDFSEIHSLNDLKNYSKRSSIPYDEFIPDRMKGVSPSGSLRNGKSYKYSSSSDGRCYIRLDDECYYYYNDINKMTVVDTMTVPANTIIIDADSKFPELKNTASNVKLEPYEDSQNCDLKGLYYMYQHAGEKNSFKADTGKYKVWCSGGYVGDYCEVYDKSVTYSKVRMKFNDAFPGLADENLTITKETSSFDEKHTLVFDLRGDQSKLAFTAVYHSGSVISAPIPDKDGYVEFWVSNEIPAVEMDYDFDWSYTLNSGSTVFGGGGGSLRTAKLAKSIEDLNFVFKYPEKDYCLYNVKPETYTIYIDNKADSRDYSLSLSKLNVKDTKDMQRFNVTVNKKPLLLGDCNRDGVIDVTDVVMIAAHVKSKRILDGRGPVTADVNESGDININDIIAIAAHVKGKKLIPAKYV